MAEITDQMEKLVEKSLSLHLFRSTPFLYSFFLSHLISFFPLLVKHGSRDNTTEGQLV